MKRVTYFFGVLLFLTASMALLVSCGDEGGGGNATSTPEITGVSPDSGFVGDQVTISANGLVPQPEENIVRFNGIRAQITSVSPGQLMTTVPSGATSGTISLEVVGTTTYGPFFKLLTPTATITSVVPTSGRPGDRVTITGTNFVAQAPVAGVDTSQSAPPTLGARQQYPTPPVTSDIPDTTTTRLQEIGDIIVTVGGIAAPVISASPTQIIIEIPAKAIDGAIVISIDGQRVDSQDFNITFDVITPEITGIAPTSGMPGDAVTISGDNFDLDDAVGVSFNGTEATVTGSSATEITTTVPDGATTGRIAVTIGEQTATGPAFTVRENQAPSITSNAEFETAENATSVGTVTASDPDGDELSFSLSGGDDQDAFTINETSGELAFSAAPDFENPGDTNTDNDYKVQVQASDGTQTATQNITVTVTNVYENGAPSITSDASFEIPENTTGVGTITANDPNKDDLTFSISGGADEDQFTIDGTTGELAFSTAPDFENPADANADNDYSVSVQVTDGNETASQAITVTVTDVDENQAPAITSDASFEVEENMTGVGTITATDPDGDDLAFTISGGDDAGQFAIDAGSGALKFSAAPDFENPGDADTDNVYNVSVQVSDGTETASQDVTVTVTDVDENQAPAITSEASFEVPENTTAAGTITATDPNSDELTFSISGGDDASSFTIDGSTGELAFSAAPDFENPTDTNTDNAYLVQVQASDGTQSATQNITVSVTDVDENVAPVITSDAAFSVEENTTAAGTVTATDANGDVLAYSISGGDDADAFTIDGSTGELAFSAAPDFENPGDTNTDNAYQVTVQVTDGAETVSQEITVTVTDLDENQPPTITSGTSFNVEENTTTVVALTATDPNSDDLVNFTVNGGADQALFAVDASTESLIFRSAPDFENPADADTDNVYEVQVQATDGFDNVTQDITVTVTNVNEGGPTITSDAGITATEGETAVTTVTATDPDGDELTFSITSGADQDDFTIGSASGDLVFNDAPDFANPTDSDTNNEYIVQIEVSDGTSAATKTLTITVPSPFAGGDGTSGNPYKIANLNQLQRVGDFLSNHFVQINDIDASATASAGYGDGSGFTPIGTGSDYSNSFTGSYNGGGFTISGLTINRPSVNHIGLFGSMFNSESVIKDVSLTNVNITGGFYAGALIGFNYSGSITNITVSGTVNGDKGYTGGMIGKTFGPISDSKSSVNVTGEGEETGGFIGENSGTLTRCSATGTVNSTGNKTGGLAGRNGGTIEDSFATGDVTGASRVGGAVGENSSRITTTYALGNVNGDTFVGGFAGYTSNDISRSYATGDVTGSNDVGGFSGINGRNVRLSYAVGAVNGSGSNVGGLNGRNHFSQYSYWDVKTTGQTTSEGGVGLQTYQMVGTSVQGNFPGFNFTEIWKTNANYYPTLQSNPQPDLPTITVENQPPSITSSASFTATEGETAVTTITASDPDMDGLSFSIIGGADQDDFIIGSASGDLAFTSAPDPENPADSDTNNEYVVEIEVTDGSATDSQTLTITVPLFAGGDGTSGNPYQIATLAQLQRVNNDLSGYYEQIANIDASATQNDSYGDGNGFAPIGNDLTQFGGTYNGAGFTISGLTINRPSTSSIGLFGVVGTGVGGTVENVHLTGANITGLSSTGALAGSNEGTITGSSATGTVSGGVQIGGLVGANNGPITGSSASSSVSGTGARTGGLVGYNNSTITISFAIGDVSGNSNETGGLAGFNSGTISDTYATGDVSGGNDPGGLVGVNDNTVRRSYAVGAVSGDIHPGGLVGSDDFTDDSYWDIESTGQSSSSGGTGLLTSEMIGSAATTNMDGFDFSSVWTTNASFYPTLQANTQPNLPVITPNRAPSITSDASFTATEGETAVTTITASDPDGDDLTFFNIGGADQGLFTIDNSSGALAFRTAPDPDNPADSDTDNEYLVEVQVSDGSQTDSQTLTITVPLFAGGDGTAGNPYQVSTLAQLQRVQENLSASYIQTADINASATANGGYGDGRGFAPIGTFTGSYDGDGFSINGLNIRRQTESTTSNMGLFGTIDGATITDVSLTNVNIEGKNFTGGLVGEVTNSGSITGSSVSGEVRGRDDTGGLVGHLHSGTITESYFYGSYISGDEKAGGLVGTVQSGSSIHRSYVKMAGELHGGFEAGGLVAQNSGTIRNSYVIINGILASVFGDAGGLVASNSGTIENSFVTIDRLRPEGTGGAIVANNSGTVTNSYYNNDELASFGGTGTGLTTAQMQGSAADGNMTGFDFSTVWQTQTGGYPILRGVGGQ